MVSGRALRCSHVKPDRRGGRFHHADKRLIMTSRPSEISDGSLSLSIARNIGAASGHRETTEGSRACGVPFPCDRSREPSSCANTRTEDPHAQQ